MRRRYVMRGGELVPWTPPPPPAARSEQIAAPMVQGDLAPYRSMRTGETISGRAQHREHLNRYGLIEIGNERASFAARPSAGPAPGEIRDDIKRELAREPAERHAQATQILRDAGYAGPQIDRIIGE